MLVTPSPNAYPIPAPPEPNAAAVTVVFLLLLLAASVFLWWRVRRSWHRSLDEAGAGPWPSEDPDEPR